MVDIRQFPEDPADWGELSVSLSRLDLDSPDSSPVSPTELREYVASESADADEADFDRLAFLRTAQVDSKRCWIWSYVEADGTLCYLTCRLAPSGPRMVGMSEAAAVPGGQPLTPDQYLLAECPDLVYW